MLNCLPVSASSVPRIQTETLTEEEEAVVKLTLRVVVSILFMVEGETMYPPILSLLKAISRIPYQSDEVRASNLFFSLI